MVKNSKQIKPHALYYNVKRNILFTTYNFVNFNKTKIFVEFDFAPEHVGYFDVNEMIKEPIMFIGNID